MSVVNKWEIYTTKEICEHLISVLVVYCLFYNWFSFTYFAVQCNFLSDNWYTNDSMSYIVVRFDSAKYN